MQSQQRGVFLVGATIAVAIVGILLTLWMNQTMQEMRIQRAENIGASLQVVGEGVQSFIVKHHGEIGKAFDGTRPVTLTDTGSLNVDVQSESDVSASRFLRLRIGTANLAPPTAADIIRIMKLPGVGDKPPMLANADYVIKIFRQTGEQNIHAIIFINRTLQRTYSTDTDWNMMSTAVRKIGVHGGFSKPESPDRFTFPLTPSSDTNTPNDLPNPTPGAGLLAVRAGYLLSPLNSFLRRDGSQKMQGDLDMGGKRVVGVKEIVGIGDTLSLKSRVTTTGTITAQGIVSNLDIVAHGNLRANQNIESLSGNILASGGNIEAKGDADNQGNVVAARDVSAARNVAARGNVTAKGSVMAAGNVVAENRLIVGGNRDSQTQLDQHSLTLGASIDTGKRCTPNGQIGRDASGMFFVCRHGGWQTLKGDKGATGAQGSPGRQGSQGAPGPRGDRGFNGSDGKNAFTKISITSYPVNSCNETRSASKWKHNFCWLSKLDNRPCTASYTPSGDVYPDPENRPSRQRFSEGWTPFGQRGIWQPSGDYFDATGKTYYLIETNHAYATMMCLDFQ